MLVSKSTAKFGIGIALGVVLALVVMNSGKIDFSFLRGQVGGSCNPDGFQGCATNDQCCSGICAANACMPNQNQIPPSCDPSNCGGNGPCGSNQYCFVKDHTSVCGCYEESNECAAVCPDVGVCGATTSSVGGIGGGVGGGGQQGGGGGGIPGGGGGIGGLGGLTAGGGDDGGGGGNPPPPSGGTSGTTSGGSSGGGSGGGSSGGTPPPPRPNPPPPPPPPTSRPASSARSIASSVASSFAFSSVASLSSARSSSLASSVASLSSARSSSIASSVASPSSARSSSVFSSVASSRASSLSSVNSSRTSSLFSSVFVPPPIPPPPPPPPVAPPPPLPPPPPVAPPPPIAFLYCGDGIFQPEHGELCDLGPRNGQPGSLCSAGCTIPIAPPPPTFCGDGVIQKGEECDDGNTRDYDSCSSQCKRERYECGNSITESGNGEQCDNGLLNGTPESLCDAQCKLRRQPQCGDSVLDRATEECDLGTGFNRDSEDSECLSNCLLPYCGDGLPQVARGEQCDDANLFDNDGCSHLCRIEVIEAAPPEKPLRIPTPAKSNEGPGLVIFLASGAAAGFGLVRRRLLARK